MNEQSVPPPGNPAGTTAPQDTAGPRPDDARHSDAHSDSHRGPRVSGDQMRDVDRLRRSTTDRYIAGVAGGLGRHFDLDPTLIRVVLAVLTLFGGAGLLVYAAVWLFVPEDGQDRAPIEVGTDLRRVILIIAGVIALSIVFGTPFLGNGWGNGFPIPLLVLGIVGLAVFATRSQRRSGQDRNQPPPPWGSVPTASTAAPSSATGATQSPEGTTMSMTDTRTGTRTGTRTDTRATAGQQPPAWMPPPVPAYVPPPRPRRTGLVLFWPTMAMIAIALGTLGIFDTSNSVTISAYAALAVGITGFMLLVGAFVGRPGGLIALGLLSSIGLVVTSIVGVATDGRSIESQNLRDVPTSAAAVDPEYHIATGTIELNLRRVSDLSALDGRSVKISLNAGEITVLVPRGLNVHVNAEVRYAGQMNIGDEERDGLGQTIDTTVTTSTEAGAPTLDLTLDARFGHIAVIPVSRN